MLTEFKAGDKIRHIVLCRVQKVGNSANGGVFARGFASDNTAALPFISFDGYTVDVLRSLTGPRAFVVTGTIDMNRFAGDGSLQLLIQKIEPPLPEEDLSHLLPDGGVDLNEYGRRFDLLLGKIKDADILRLVRQVFSGRIWASFRTNPAGMSYHHAYIGGLLEHSVDTAELAVAMGEKVKDADQDILIAGSLLHDIGKLREISQDIGFPYTGEGKLLGHIAIGAMMAEEAALGMDPPISGEKLQLIVHIIISHHGDQEKGSPINCRTKEAFIVHYADELNSVLNQFHPREGKGWQYNKMLARNIFLGGE
ncbi:MAG: HD domain-containing protein [Acidaminococcales bacterium]|jgi:3'-5' exoribonuclease|nr:HD domain-containing protein [Acidaminococcales bacterium]